MLWRKLQSAKTIELNYWIMKILTSWLNRCFTSCKEVDEVEEKRNKWNLRFFVFKPFSAMFFTFLCTHDADGVYVLLSSTSYFVAMLSSLFQDFFSFTFFNPSSLLRFSFTFFFFLSSQRNASRNQTKK